MALRDVQAVVTITTNAAKAIDDGKKLKETYKATLDIIKQFRKDGKIDTPEGKELLKLADDLQKRINTLVTGMDLVRGVANDLATKTGSQLNRALREISKEFNKTGNETDADKQKLAELADALKKIKEDQSIRKGLTMPLEEAKKQLNDLANASPEKLRQGLEAVTKELEKTSGAAQRILLKEYASKYEAQMAVNKYGRAGSADISKMNAEQLKAEQSRLRSGYLATQGVEGFDTISEDYLKRLQEINQALKEMGNVDVSKVLKDLETGDATLADMEQALKQINADAAKIELNDDAGFKKYQEEVAQLEEGIEKVKAKMQGLTEIEWTQLENVPTEKLEAELKRLEEQEKKLAGTQKKEAAEVAQKKAMIQDQLQKNKMALQQFAKAEVIAKNAGKHSVVELQQAYETLRTKLTNLATSEKKEIARTKEQMASLKKKIEEVTGAVKQQNTIWQTAVRNITAYIGVFGAFNFIKSKVAQVFESNKQLSDSLANIRKVSGLTQESINQLYTDISKIDTRNSVQQLNDLAYAGAKLGVQEHGGAKALLGFVKAAEQVQMALGEDLGEEALPALAKLTEVMGLMDMYGVEQAMQKAASAIFMLSTTSTSTGANIVEFTKRLMGLANVSHVTSAELIALGSASDSMGLMAEVSATAFNKVFTKIQSNTAGIEKAVGLARGELKALVDDGKTMEAIVTVFDKMREMSMEEMQRRGIFKELGSDGARLNNVMTTMADRVDILKKHLDTSNKAFEEGEAVIAEYVIQNETAAAYMERAANLWEKAFTNPEGVEAVSGLAKQWHDFSKELTESALMMGSLKAALWMILQTIKGLIVLLPTLINFLLFKGALVAVTQMVTGFINMGKAIWAAVTASKALTAAQKWNGITTVLSLVAAAFMTIKGAINEADEAAERARQRQAELDKQFAESKDAIAMAVKPLQDYKKALDESNLSLDERNKRLRAYLKNEYQPYLDYLGIEIDKVEDLADAYAQVVYTMKQKAAAEEKQNYLGKVNGENRMNRIAAQAEVIRQASTMGLTLTKEDLEIYWKGNANEGVENAYQDLLKKHNYIPWELSGKYDVVKYPGLYKALEEYAGSFLLEQSVVNKVEKMFNEEYKDLDLENFSLEEFRERQLEAQIQREKDRKDTVLPTLPDKNTEKEYKEALRKELQDAKRESDAVISKIEEWYRLQETVITDMAADGKLTQEQAEQVIRTLNIAKNTALRDARLAISGRDTKTWEQTKQQIGDLMLDQGEWSSELLQQILDVSMDSIRNNLARIDAGGGQYGITTTALKDAVDKNAAGNQREIARLMNKGQQEVEKLLLQYHFVDQAMKGFSDRLAQMGILTETARHMAERLAEANDMEALYSMDDYNRQLATNEQAKRDMMQAFMASGAKPYAVNPEDKEELRQWFMEFVGDYQKNENAVGGVEYVYKSWAEPFQDDFEMWLRNKEAYAEQIQQFYFSLMQSSDEYYKAQRQQYEFYKKQNEQQWENAGRNEYYDRIYTQLGNRQKMQDVLGIGQNFGQQYGLANVISSDPEVELYKQKLQAAAEYYQFVEQHQHTEQELREAGQKVLESYLDMAKKVGDEVAERASKIQSLQAPATEFAENVGQKWGEMIAGMEEQSMTWNQIIKKMILSFAQMTIKMATENITKKIQQALFYKQMQTMEIEHQTTLLGIQTAFGAMQIGAQQAINTTLQTQKSVDDATTVTKEVTLATILTQLGISEGAAKTIGKLGWWGIPLVAVISSLLMGLLSGALSTAKKSTSATTSSTTNANKIKIVSGMLTYDEGNTGSYLGNDGHVYRAREAGQIPEGVSLVKQPIATTVNGQRALVAEKGPEIVIGRKTTQRIMMNEPRLLHHLATLGNNRSYGGYRGLRTFDAGNLGDITLSRNNGTTNAGERNNEEINAAVIAALEQNAAAMAAFSQVMQAIQKKGIPATVQQFGKGSLDEGMRSVNNFRRRYPV